MEILEIPEINIMLKLYIILKLKEVERERMLIIEGKSDVIPDELADDPIFMVNKDANLEIMKERSKVGNPKQLMHILKT